MRSSTPEFRASRARFARALDDALDAYAAACTVACVEPDPVTRSRALAAAKAEHERAVAVAVAFADRLDS